MDIVAWRKGYLAGMKQQGSDRNPYPFEDERTWAWASGYIVGEANPYTWPQIRNIPHIQNFRGPRLTVNASRVIAGGGKKNRPRVSVKVSGNITSSGAVLPSTPSDPALLVKLEGAERQNVLVDSDCTLVVEIKQLDSDGSLTEISGEIIQEAIDKQLEVSFQLCSGLFVLTEGKSRIDTRFTADGFQTPVRFKLRAPAQAAMMLILNVDMEIHDVPIVRIPVTLNVVERIRHVTSGNNLIWEPEKLNFDELYAMSRAPKPGAVLRIETYNRLPASFAIPSDSISLEGGSHALGREGISAICKEIADLIGETAGSKLWIELKDPLNPSIEELEQHDVSLKELLKKVAVAGFKLYEWLTRTAGMKEIVDLINGLQNDTHIMVRSDSLSLPWDIIYPLPVYADQQPDKPIDHAQFWGFRFKFESSLIPVDQLAGHGYMNRALLATHREAPLTLTSSFNGDIDQERNTWNAGPPVSSQKSRLQTEFKSALLDIEECDSIQSLVQNELNSSPFIYFFGHSQGVQELQFTGGCRIEKSSVSYNRTFNSAPIVFLNACTSGAMCSVSYDDFTARFLSKGALGLITTAFSIPTPFAARFGCELVVQYMSGKRDLGAVLLDLRRETLKKSIPIGLFYLLQCPPSAKRNQT